MVAAPAVGKGGPLRLPSPSVCTVALADGSGSESLSMRKLGEAVGVEAMSLYHHVASKEDLLDGMIDVVFGEIDMSFSGVDWKTAMRERGISGRRVLSRHGWAIGFMESRNSPGPATLRHHATRRRGGRWLTDPPGPGRHTDRAGVVRRLRG